MKLPLKKIGTDVALLNCGNALQCGSSVEVYPLLLGAKPIILIWILSSLVHENHTQSSLLSLAEYNTPLANFCAHF